MWGAAFCADKYDQLVIAWRHGPPNCVWGGLAAISFPITWTSYPSGLGLMAHEVCRFVWLSSCLLYMYLDK